MHYKKFKIFGRFEIAKNRLEQIPDSLFWTVSKIWVENLGYGRFGSNRQEFQMVWPKPSKTNYGWFGQIVQN